MPYAHVRLGLLLTLWVAATGCQDGSSPASNPPVKSADSDAALSPARQSKAPTSEVPSSTNSNQSAASSNDSKPSAVADQRPEGIAIASEASAQAGGGAGNLFVGWDRPDLVMVFSGEQMGYLEPCGCAGLENQKGGLSRRHTLVKEMAAKNWPVANFDLGNQVKRFGPQQEIKFHTTIEALKTIGYSAVAFGPDDLRLPVGELISDVADEQAGFVAANVAFQGFEDLVPKYRVIERGGRKVAVTAILGERAWEKVNNDELAYKPAAEVLAKVVAEMKTKADLLVLLSHATPQESEELARKFPDFKIVVTAGGADEPPAEPESASGSDAWMVEVGHKGMYVAAIGLFGNSKQPMRYQRVPLDKRFRDSPAMHNIMVAYQGQLRDRGLAGLSLQPVPHASGRKFVGSQTCADCHTKAHEEWSKTPHSHATETLVKLDPPRQFDPECLSCHVTGWEPQKYFPFVSGYLNLEKTPQMTANGCENCHGPGSEHVAVELGEMQVDDKQRDKLRDQMRLPLEAAEKHCRTCHDADNSPEFDWDIYWPKIEHRGKD